MITNIRHSGVLVHQVIEQEIPFLDFREFFPTLSDEIFDENSVWLKPDFLDPTTGNIILRIQSYVLKCPHHIILIDPCVGNHKPRPNRPIWHMMNGHQYERSLGAIGLSPDDIDYVLCTHLHPDHVG